MCTSKFWLYCCLLSLYACHENNISSQSNLLFPPDNQRIEQEPIFAQLLSAGYCLRTINRSGNKLAVVNRYKLQVWDLQEKRMIAEHLFSNFGTPRRCEFSASEEQVIVITDEDNLVVFDLSTRQYSNILNNVIAVSQHLNYAAQENGKCSVDVFAVNAIDDVIVSGCFKRGDIAFSPNERYFVTLNDGDGATVVRDLQLDEVIYKDNLIWKFVTNPTLSNDGKKIIAAGSVYTKDMMLAKIIDRDSAVIVKTQMAEDPTLIRDYAFSEIGNHLCVGSTGGTFRIYDCSNLEIVYEEALSSSLPYNGDVFIDTTYLFYANRGDGEYMPRKIVLNQRTLESVDTLYYPKSFSLFNTTSRPIRSNADGKMLMFYNSDKQSIDTLDKGNLIKNHILRYDYVSSNLSPSRGYKIFSLEKFDLNHLDFKSHRDSISKYVDSDLREVENKSTTTFSPRWKYLVSDDAIFSCSSGQRIMSLPFLSEKFQSWQIIYSYAEDRVVFSNFHLKRIIVLDLQEERTLLDKTYFFAPKHISFSPTGEFLVLAGEEVSSLKIERLGNSIPGIGFGRFYDKSSWIENVQVSPNGKWLQVRAWANNDHLATIWSIETGEVVYQTKGRLVLISDDSDIVLWSTGTDTLKRISVFTGEEKWARSFKGEHYGMRVPANANYLTYIEDGVYQCFTDLVTGQELWQLGESGKGRRYFVKSSQYPIVHTNYLPFLKNFHYQDAVTKQTMYPTPESLQDTSQYLQRVTRQVLSIKPEMDE